MLSGETTGGQIITGLNKCAIITFELGDSTSVSEAEERLKKIVESSQSYSLVMHSSGAGSRNGREIITTIVVCYAEKAS